MAVVGNFCDAHLATSVEPSVAAKNAIIARIATVPMPNVAVYGAQGSPANVPGYNLYALAAKYGFLPNNIQPKFEVYCQQEVEWRNLGYGYKPAIPSYSIEAQHFRVDPFLVIAELASRQDIADLATQQAKEAIQAMQADKYCLDGYYSDSVTNPRGYGYPMDGMRNYYQFNYDYSAAMTWCVMHEKLYQHMGTSVGTGTGGADEPFLTNWVQGAEKADHGYKRVCTWFTGRAGLAIAHGLIDLGGWTNERDIAIQELIGIDDTAEKVLECMIYAEERGSDLTGISGRLVDDYWPGDHLLSSSVMPRWAWPCCRALADAGVPGAQDFLDGPIHDIWETDNLMKPSEWKASLGAAGAQHVASIAAYMAPAFGWRE